MIDLLKPLLDWTSLPRQTVDAGRMIIAGGEPRATAPATVSAICWVCARFWRWIIM